MLPTQLLSRYSQGERDFSGIDLSGTDFYHCRDNRNLSGIDLSRANLCRTIFSEVDLSNVTFKNANLQGAKFYRCKLQGVDFSDADMTDAELHCEPVYGANFNRANLSRANLSSADLSGSTLFEANLSHAEPRRANLSGTDLRKALLEATVMSADHSGYGQVNLHKANLSGVDFKRINLSRVNLSEADLSNANLSHSDLSNANLTQADLTKANLSFARFDSARFRQSGSITQFSVANIYYKSLLGADLSAANLSNADLSNANFTDAVLCGANLSEARMENVNFTRTRLENVEITDSQIAGNEKILLTLQLLNGDIAAQRLAGVDLSETNLDGTNFSNANLRGASFAFSTLTRVNLSNADLRDANLSYSNLSLANLQGADLSNANLQEANLEGADLTGVVLQDAILRDANLQSATLVGANLSRSTLSGANVKSANLTDAVLTNADLSCTNLNHADFTGVDLSAVDLSQVSAFHAKLIDAHSVPETILSIDATEEPDALSAVRKAASGLTHNSEGNEPYEVFFWSSEAKGEFSLESLLKSMGYIRTFSVESFFEDFLFSQNSDTQQLGRALKRLTSQIEPYVTSIEIWQLTTLSLQEASSTMLYLVIAETIDSDWLAITTEVDSIVVQDAQSSPTFIERDDIKLNPDYTELIEHLKSAVGEANNNLPNSEATGRLIWELGKRRQSIIQNLLIASKHMTIVPYEEDFFQQDWTDDETEREQRQALADAFSTHTSNRRLYRIGGGRIDFYLMGQLQEDDWIGVRTEVTWT